MCEYKSNVFWCVVLLNVYCALSFNVETFNYAILKTNGRDPNSMFGFTVAEHKEGSMSWVLVGAPEAQSEFQPGVDRGGAVYKCRTDTDNVCYEVPFDRTAHHIIGDNHRDKIDSKDKQWFGATLSTSGANSGRVVACAPRYVWFTKKLSRRDPVGTCYVSSSEQLISFEEYSPCRTANWGYHRQGSCQAGFSAAINNVGDRLYIGAPGSYYWQGQMYSVDANARFNFTPGMFGATYGQKGSVHQQSLETRPAVFSTKEGTSRDDDSYMGYSSVVGDFQGTGEQGIVVGMPRGAELHGKILFFTWNLTNYNNISSSKLGSYFGYSLAAADVDGDRKLDLIVGAPMHTETNNEGKYDVGRVYIFYHHSLKYGDFKFVHTLDGFNSKSRFGHSLSTLGDLNQDGYDDFAVGAPYDGAFGRGAVYIYYGSSEGVLMKYGQVIYAEDLKVDYPVNTFGFSVAGGMDMDGNEYPDLAVGAYLSETAFFFRSRPVVRVDAFVKFLTANNQIDLKQHNCQLPNGQPGTCTDIDFCVKYSGKGIPDQIYLDLQYILDVKKLAAPRLAFIEHNSHAFNETILLRKDTPQRCTKKQVFLKSELRDKLTPIEAEVRYSMSQTSRNEYDRRDPNSQLLPILDLNSPPSKKDSISIQKNCGPDNICIPNLHLNITSNVQKYLLGSNNNLEFGVIVSNHGEDSFESTFEMKYPEGIYFKKIETNDTHNIQCNSPENRTIKCNIGNPLPASKIAVFRIWLQPYHKEGMAPSYEFDMYVNSTNPENTFTMADNHQHVSIDIWIDSTLELDGISYPHEVQYNLSRYTAETITKENDIGPQVVHVYTLKNKGPAKIQEAEIFFLWPYLTLGGEDLLYLLDQPATMGNVQCAPVPANYKNYELNYHTKSIWERLKIDTEFSEFESSSKDAVKFESGDGIKGEVGGSVSSSQGKLDAEVGTSGDASLVHQRRQNESHIISTGPQYRKYVESHWKKIYIDGVPMVNFTNTTTIRDGQGNIVQTYTSSSTEKYVPSALYSGSSGAVDLNRAEYEATVKKYGQGIYGQQQSGRDSFSTSHSSGGQVSTSHSGHSHAGRVQEGNGQQINHHGGIYYGNQESRGQSSYQDNRAVGGSVSSSHGKLDAQVGPSGDASLVHQRRQNESHIISTGPQYRKYVESHWKKIYIDGVPMVNFTNTTTIRDGQGNIVQTYTSTSTEKFVPSALYSGSSGAVDLNRAEYEATVKKYGQGIYGQQQSGGESVSTSHSSGGQVSTSHSGHSYGGHQESGGRNQVDSGQQINHYGGRHGSQESRGQSGFQDNRGQGQTVHHESRVESEYESRGQSGHLENREPGQPNYNTGYQENRGQGERVHYETRVEGGYQSSRGQENREQGSRGYSQSGAVQGGSQSQGGSYGQASYSGGKGSQESHVAYDNIGYDEEDYGSYEEEENGNHLTESRYESGGSSYQSGGDRQQGVQGGVVQGGAAHTEGNSGYIDEHGVYRSINKTAIQNKSQEGGRQSFGGLEINSGGFEEAALGHGFTINTLDLGQGGKDININQGGSQWRVEGGGQHSGERNAGRGGNVKHTWVTEETIERTGEIPPTYVQGGGSGAGDGNLQKSWSTEEHVVHSGQIPTTYISGHVGNNDGSISKSWSTEEHVVQRGEVPLTFHRPVERDNVPTDKPNLNNRYRGRRDVNVVIPNGIDCKSTKCLHIKCVVNVLEKDKEVSVALRSRVNVRAIRELGTTQPIKFSSLMLGRISKLPYIGTPREQDLQSYELFTEIPAQDTESKPYVVPLWIVVLSSVAGTLALLLIVYLLYKCGFFKRDRPPTAPERQPLNRNGYHHGDEAL